MQYIPLTVHLNAMAQLYQQCAALSEKCDKQNANDEFEENHAPVESQKIVLENFQDQMAHILEQNNFLKVVSKEQAQSTHQEQQSSESSKPEEQNSNKENEVELDIAEVQGSESISKATKKIKKSDTIKDKSDYLKCEKCGKLLKNRNSLRKHTQRQHQSKPVKNHTKKITNKQDIQVQI